MQSGEDSSRQRLSTNELMKSIELRGTSPVQANASPPSFPILAKTLAFTIVFGAICAAAIILPILVTNILKGKTTTTTTSKEMNSIRLITI